MTRRYKAGRLAAAVLLALSSLGVAAAAPAAAADCDVQATTSYYSYLNSSTCLNAGAYGTSASTSTYTNIGSISTGISTSLGYDW
ncbi:hypothetical protein [Promicromonospora iranensis]|uniref:Uncharacterized protein n=1 Tax=Promicromonospora iranensis TaxID=1105144 RepID=A0ABU2CIM1_9MICO|nr:hypothetical protein [Promicromonospora iranensis]MDR7381191.1 hypothetical protein [Promicromonospora iranensis]